MKKFFSTLLNIAAISGFIVAFAIIAGTIFFSYQFIDKISQPAPSQSLREIAGRLSAFNSIDKIEQEMAKTSVPPLCEILCDQSRFDFSTANEASRENPVLYLKEFYEQERARSFKDPKFRLTLEMTAVYSSVFHPAIRQAVAEMSQVTNHVEAVSQAEKLSLAVKVPAMILRAGAHIATGFNDLRIRADRASDLRMLRASCHRENAATILQKCEQISSRDTSEN